MPVCGNYLFFELPKKIVLNPKDGRALDSRAGRDGVVPCPPTSCENRESRKRMQKNFKYFEFCLYKSLGLVYNSRVRNRAISVCAISSIG